MKTLNDICKNLVTVNGTLMSMSSNAGKTKDGRPYESVRYTVQVTQEYDGREETSDIELRGFAMQFKNDGGTNPSYEAIQRLKNLKTVQNYGFTDADKVSITRGTLKESSFVSKNTGSLVTAWELDSNFPSKARKPDLASFNIDIFIRNMEDETDWEGETTGRLVVTGVLVQYGGNVDEVKFIVENPDSIEHISRNWNIGDTVNVGGRIREKSVEITRNRQSTSSWGEEIPETSTRVVRELIITRGSDTPYDEDEAYDPTEIKKGLNARKARIDQMANTTKSEPKIETTKKKFDWASM